MIGINRIRYILEYCGGVCELRIPKEMTHENVDFYDDFTYPFFKFLQGTKFQLYKQQKHKPFIPVSLFRKFEWIFEIIFIILYFEKIN